MPAMSSVWKAMQGWDNAIQHKSRCMWVVGGEKNSRCFHNSLNEIYKINMIMALDTSQGRIEEVDDIKMEASSFFKKIFVERNYSRPKLDGVHFDMLMSTKSCFLEAPFLLEEVKEVAGDNDGDHSPGPYGYNMIC